MNTEIILAITGGSFLFLLLTSIVIFFSIKNSELWQEILQKKEEILELEKIKKLMEDQRNQAHRVIAQQGKLFERIRGEVQILLSLLHGTLLVEKFALVYRYPSGVLGEEAFNVFSWMLKHDEELSEMFSLKREEIKGEFQQMREWYELNETGKEFFSNPINGTTIFFSSIDCKLALAGTYAEVLEK